ncbi:formimidoylglutamate deiminase [Pseudactinotalea terrae]|uniref:formimidoylglutamate deiminase n=1 Tax=Pseudactinotalea terrae TaxID=1743262 RepID=UPI0012E30718|nr:formimidoylglutamate deiminase [Pseudactinotalea terrae]
MTFWCERAWLPDGVASRVRIVASGGVIVGIVADADPQPEDERLRGLVLPGLANAHSHAFHRALRGRTHGEGGTFWTWRTRMYAVAARLDPDSYLALARASYAEMVLAGITSVGEFHYLHHAPGGTRYADPLAMSTALVQAAADAGLRLTLLDTCYLAGGLTGSGYAPLADEQLRFSDGTADAWSGRHEQLRVLAGPRVVIGSAVHSVRAVPAEALPVIAAAAEGEPLHVHLSEQPAENEACVAAHGVTPTRLLADHGLLGPFTTAVHAIHLSPADIALLGQTATAVCACPTTEADLADGIGPFPELAAAGSPLCLGTDQHASSDILLEAQRLDAHQRLRSGERSGFAPGTLLQVATEHGQRALGQPGGSLEVGAPADLVALDLDTPRMAGTDPAQATLVAGAADVRTVVVAGEVVVRDRAHRLGDVGALLRSAVEPLWESS